MEKISDMKTTHGSSFGDVADETAMKVEDVQVQQRAAQSFDAKHMFLVLAADAPRFTVVALSAAFAAVLRSGDQARFPAHSPAMDARGRALAEVLWLTDSDALGMDAVALATSFGRVIDSGMPDAMPLRRCAISRSSSSSRGCSVVRRWWSMLSFPMFGADGRVCHIVFRLEDVSDAMQMQLARTSRVLRTARTLRPALL